MSYYTDNVFLSQKEFEFNSIFFFIKSFDSLRSQFINDSEQMKSR